MHWIATAVSAFRGADLLCETKPDCFSLLSSIVVFKYASQYHQLAPTNQSITTIPQGGGRALKIHPREITGWKNPLCAEPQFQHTHPADGDGVENTALFWQQPGPH